MKDNTFFAVRQSTERRKCLSQQEYLRNRDTYQDGFQQLSQNGNLHLMKKNQTMKRIRGVNKKEKIQKVTPSENQSAVLLKCTELTIQILSTN